MADFRAHVEQVRALTDLPTLLEERYQITVQNHQALCPFHADTNPSMSVSEGLYHCFACQAGGDVFHFVQQKEGLTFQAAVDLLAERAGLLPYRQTQADRDTVAHQRAAADLTEWAARYYELRLTRAGHDYLTEQRRLPPDIVRQARVGWADGGLTEALTQAGGDPAGLLLAGLGTASHTGAVRDWLQDRLDIPTLQQGRAIFLSGRTLDPKREPKYLHQRGRSAPVFNMDVLREPEVIVVEGQLDTLSLTAWGFNAVGLMGTPHQAHLQAMARPEKLYLCLDSDRAGRAATVKLAAGLGPVRCRVVQLPPGQDPNDYYQAHTSADFAALLEAAVGPVQFVLDQVAMPPASMDDLTDLFWLFNAMDPVQVTNFIDRSVTAWARGRRPLVQAIRDGWALWRTGPHQCPVCGAKTPRGYSRD